MLIGRRSFLTGLLAAPIIVRPGILMPVKPLADPFQFEDITWTASEGNLSGLRWAVVWGRDERGDQLCEVIKLPPLNEGGGTTCNKQFRSVNSVEITSTIPGFDPIVRSQKQDLIVHAGDTVTVFVPPVTLA